MVDAVTLAAVRDIIEAPKQWVGHSVRWVANGRSKPGYKFQNALSLNDGLHPAGLFVYGYFKQAGVPGAQDKLYLSMRYMDARVVGLDDNGPSTHRNDVGRSLPYYRQRIDHPHSHRICDDALEGYAEPEPRREVAEMWSTFLQRCNIIDAPQLVLPIVQLTLPV